MNKHQIDGPFTDDLICDVNVAALGIVRRGGHDLVHPAASFSPIVAGSRKSVAADRSHKYARFLMHQSPSKVVSNGSVSLCASVEVIDLVSRVVILDV